MKTDSINIEQILKQRLEKKGIEPSLIPGFIKDLTNTFFLNPDYELPQIVGRLRYLGWDDFELDDHTLQLAKACFEAGGSKRRII